MAHRDVLKNRRNKRFVRARNVIASSACSRLSNHRGRLLLATIDVVHDVRVQQITMRNLKSKPIALETNEYCHCVAHLAHVLVSLRASQPWVRIVSAMHQYHHRRTKYTPSSSWVAHSGASTPTPSAAAVAVVLLVVGPAHNNSNNNRSNNNMDDNDCPVLSSSRIRNVRFINPWWWWASSYSPLPPPRMLTVMAVLFYNRRRLRNLSTRIRR
jgi:hypothetical protein